MYFRALMLSGCVALAGCQSTEVIEQVQVAQAQQVDALSELQSVKMKLPSSAIVDITSQSQVLKYQGIDSRVAVFELPADRGEFAIKITSLIEDTAFVPRAIIVDKNGKEIENYGKAEFEYTKPRLHLGNRLVAEKDFFPPVGLRIIRSGFYEGSLKQCFFYYFFKTLVFFRHQNENKLF